MAPEHVGQRAFISRNGGLERFWAESRVVEFCAQHAEILEYAQARRGSGGSLAHGMPTRGQGKQKFQP
jgi:hypothetical protein